VNDSNDTSDAALAADSSSAFRRTGAIISDYYGFINLVIYLVLILPAAWLLRRVDRVFGTRCVDKVITFCELF
jgi:hypothetical protein